jgi:lysophospholipase L1-like esterase
MRLRRSSILLCASLAALSVSLPVSSPAAGASVESVSSTLPPSIASAKRIVILGDSITYAGGYVDFVEAVLRTRIPSWKGEIIDVGLASETVSGLSEDGHAGGKFPRPDLHERLGRVLTQLKPDLVIACYGMNDGIYHPFSEERFAKFREGMTRLHEAVLAAHSGIIHVTPPVFDPVPIAAKVLPAGRDTYPQPFAGYDDVLARYSIWLMGQRAQGWDVIDVHSLMSATLTRMRQQDPKFSFSKDGVHPDTSGHAVIARAILAAWNLRPDEGELLTRLSTPPEPEFLKLIRERRRLLESAWLTAIGHTRPGVTAGLLLAEAEAKAAALTEKIGGLK